MATIIYPDGTQIEIQPRNGHDFQLDELHAIVDGHIEIIPTRDGRIMVGNDDSKLLGLPRSEAATALAQLATPQEKAASKKLLEGSGFRVLFFGNPNEPDYVAGSVLVCERHEVE